MVHKLTMIHGGSRRRRKMRKANSVQTAGIGSFLVKAGKGVINPIKNAGSNILGAGSKVADKAKNSVRNLGPFSKAAGGTVAGIPAGEFAAEKLDLSDGNGGGGVGQNGDVDDGLRQGQQGSNNVGGQPPPSSGSGSGGLLPTISDNRVVNLGAYLAVGSVLAGGAVLAYKSISSDGEGVLRRIGSRQRTGTRGQRRRGQADSSQSRRRQTVSSQTSRGQTQNQSAGTGRQTNQTQQQGTSGAVTQQQVANTNQGGVFQ